MGVIVIHLSNGFVFLSATRVKVREDEFAGSITQPNIFPKKSMLTIANLIKKLIPKNRELTPHLSKG